jgi:hypothetical protein
MIDPAATPSARLPNELEAGVVRDPDLLAELRGEVAGLRM